MVLSKEPGIVLATQGVEGSWVDKGSGGKLRGEFASIVTILVAACLPRVHHGLISHAMGLAQIQEAMKERTIS